MMRKNNYMGLEDEEEHWAHNYQIALRLEFCFASNLLGGRRIVKRMHGRSIITGGRVPKIPILIVLHGVFLCWGDSRFMSEA